MKRWREIAVLSVVFLFFAVYAKGDQRHWHYQNIGINGDGLVTGDWTVLGTITGGIIAGAAESPITDGWTVNILWANTNIFVGPTAGATDFPNALAIFSDFNGGAGNTTHVGLVIETRGEEGQRTVGIDIYPYMFGDENAIGYNVTGQGAAARLGDIYGYRVISTEAGTAGKNFGFYCDVQNGTSIYCYYGAAGEFYQADAATFDDAVNLVNLTGIYQFRTLAGDGSSDLDIWGIYDGSTLVNKIWFDDTGSNIEVTGNFQALKLVSLGSVVGANVAATNYVRSPLFQSLVDTLNLEVDLNGISGGAVTISMLDDATVWATHATDGDTYVITSVQGDLELAAKDGSAVVFPGSTITINGGDITSITGAELETVTHHHGQQGGGYFDFTGACSDGETITIDGKTFEFDDQVAPDCTGAEDYCVDVNASQAAADCASALVSAINTAAINFSADLETDIAIVVGHTVGDNLSLAETGTNITRSAANLAGDETPRKHIMHHFDYTVTSADETALFGATGAITIGAIESAILPNLIGWHVFDSVGEVVDVSNISIVLENTSGNHYSVTIRDSAGGGTDFDAGDILTAHFVAHE